MTNYFELFDIKPSLEIEQGALKKKFYSLSKQFHPDYHKAKTEDSSEEEVLQQAAYLNIAYKTLSHQDLLWAYVLQLNGLLEENEKYSLSPDFLMEMMELNELISDYEDQKSNTQLKERVAAEVQNQLDQLQQSAQKPIAAYALEPQDIAALKALKELYFRKKYLLRIQERLATFANPIQ